MAGDWFPFRLDLHEDPAVLMMAARLDVTANEIVGGLARVWGWFSGHSRNGHATVTHSFLNRHAGVSELCAAMLEAGWLRDDGEGNLSIPRWDRWLGESAKKRLNAAIRQRRKRLRDGHADVTQPSRSQRDKSVTTGQDSTGEDIDVPPSAVRAANGMPRRATKGHKEPSCLRRFTDGWCARFLAAKGTPYGFNGGVDQKHAVAILKLAGLPAEPTPAQESAALSVALERADRLLSSTDDWYVGKGVDLGTLRKDFNRLGSAGRGSRDVRIGRAEAAPHSAFEKTGTVEDF